MPIIYPAGSKVIRLGGRTRGVTITPPASPGVTAPTLTSATQNYAAQGTTQTIILQGSLFDGTCTAVFSNPGITVNSYGAITGTSLPVNITVAGGAATGAGTVQVHSPTTGNSATIAFSVNTVASRAVLYPTSSAAPSLAPSNSHSATLPLGSHFDANGGALWRALNATNGSNGANIYTQTTAGSVSQSAFWGGFVSKALVAGTIGAGTWTFKYGLYSENGSAYQIAPVLYVWRPSTSAVVGTIYDSATGIGSSTSGVTSTSTAGHVTTFSGSSVTVQDGDLLVLETYAVGTGSNFLHFQYNGATTVTEGGDVGAGGTTKAELDPPAALSVQA